MKWKESNDLFTPESRAKPEGGRTLCPKSLSRDSAAAAALYQ